MKLKYKSIRGKEFSDELFQIRLPRDTVFQLNEAEKRFSRAKKVVSTQRRLQMALDVRSRDRLFRPSFRGNSEGVRLYKIDRSFI